MCGWPARRRTPSRTRATSRRIASRSRSNRQVAWPLPERRSDRLRAIGWAVLVIGMASAAEVYAIKARAADAALDDTNALGYARSMQHGIGVMMGASGAILTEWQQNLTSPLGQALIVAACAALTAGYFFRIAWVLDAEEEDGG